MWLKCIRDIVWQRADSEDHTMPSIEALKLHWKRSLWVILMWNVATQNDIELPMSEYGWERLDDKLNIVWDVPENITRVQKRIEYILLKGMQMQDRMSDP